jgi:hypothetical protein
MPYTFVTDAEIVEFFKGVTENASFAVTDIPLLIRGNATTAGTAFDLIVQRSQYNWQPSSITETLYFNGEGIRSFFVRPIPILTLTEVKVFYPGGSEYAYTLTGDDKNIWWDPDTGCVSTDQGTGALGGIEFGTEPYSAPDIFPNGLQNIMIKGTFGINTPAIAKMLQLLIMYKQLEFQNPTVYKKAGNIVEEQIGRYSYKLGMIGTSKTTYKSLDDYIDSLFDALPHDNTYAFEAV